jgi:hypothetical protein
VTAEVREADATLAAKNGALSAHDLVFAGVANVTSALLKAAGEKELAGKVRPSAKKPGRTAELAAQEPGSEPELLPEEA